MKGVNGRRGLASNLVVEWERGFFESYVAGLLVTLKCVV